MDDTYEGVEISIRHYGWEPLEVARLKEGWGESVSIADEDGYLTVEEGQLRVRQFLPCMGA